MSTRCRLFPLSIEMLIASILALASVIGMSAEADIERNLLHDSGMNYPLATPEEDMDMQISCFNGISSEQAAAILDLSKSQKYYSMQTYYILHTKGFKGADKHIERFVGGKIDNSIMIYFILKGRVNFTVDVGIAGNTYLGHCLNDMPEELQKHWKNLFLRGICLNIPDSKHDSPADPPQKCIYLSYPNATQEEDIQAQIRCIESISKEEAEQLINLSQSQKRYSLQTYYLLKIRGFEEAEEQMKGFDAIKMDYGVAIYLRIIGLLKHQTSYLYFGQTADEMPNLLLKHWKQLYKKGISILLIPDNLSI